MQTRSDISDNQLTESTSTTQGRPVSAVNAVMAWLIIQIVDVVSEPLILPD